MTRKTLAVLAASLLAISPVCAADDEERPERTDETCPRVAVLADAGHGTVFDGKGRDVTNIAYQVSLERPSIECRHRKGGRLDITVKAEIRADLGLAAETREIEVPYFLAIIDPEELVVTKEPGVGLVKVERGARSGTVEVESKTIKLILEGETIGADLEVLLGLQLDKDQLDYNRTGH